MEAIRSSETSIDFQRITQRYVPEDSNLHGLSTKYVFRVKTGQTNNGQKE
jgi:hypothetical protein